jgi:hypothetical protein
VAAHQQQPQQAQQAHTAADKAQVAQVLDLAQQLEYSGQQDEALELLRQSERLSRGQLYWNCRPFKRKKNGSAG